MEPFLEAVFSASRPFKPGQHTCISKEVLEKTSQLMMEMKGAMYNFEKEANCQPILVAFLIKLNSYINEQNILNGTVQLDLEFVVCENRQVVRNPSKDAAMVVFFIIKMKHSHRFCTY